MEGLKQENDSLRKELQALQKETNESMLIVTDDYVRIVVLIYQLKLDRIHFTGRLTAT